jgi:hypothetical protein
MVHHVAKRIQELLEQQPFAYCDACLGLRFAVSLEEARAAALSVAQEPGYVRRRDTCETCNRSVELTASAVRLRRI